MAAWGEVIPDVLLAVLYTYLLIRLEISNDVIFKTPFFKLFIVTGVYSIISVLSFVVMSQFFYTESYWSVHIYRFCYALNVFGACGATMGKAFIAIHRYVVMRSRDFSEMKWSGTILRRFFIAQFTISLVRTAPVWPAGFRYENGEIVALDVYHTLILKAFSVGTYLLYIVCNGICTVLTFRELMRMRKNQEASMRLIMLTQRNLFIIVTVCSVSYFIKALHQFAIAASTFLSMYDLYNHLYATVRAFTFNCYPIVNGLATYAAPVCLVILSSKVRAALIFCRSRQIGCDSAATVYTK